jgi:16S rRNA (uracil1498-N3)-methyltransferase
VTTLRDRADAAAQVFVDELDAPALTDGDLHHLARVLRLRDGERVVAGDGRGGWRLCAFSRDHLEPLGEVVVDPAPRWMVSVWLPAVRGERAEWAVQKLTELGVDEIGLLACERASVRLDAAGADKVLTRWRRVAREAACQSRRTRLPECRGPVDVAGVVARGAVQCDLDGELILDAPTSLAVGPEGGWANDERPEPAAAVSLAEAVLRTGTAAVAAAVLLCAARHGAGREAQ